MLLRGQGDIHLKLAVDRLKSRFNVEVDAARPQTAYKETIRKATKQHSRFKRQPGGRGQFGAVHVAIRPLPRGQGFAFAAQVVGGALPPQSIGPVAPGATTYLSPGTPWFPV